MKLGWWICRKCKGFFGAPYDVSDEANKHEEETGHKVEWVSGEWPFPEER